MIDGNNLGDSVKEGAPLFDLVFPCPSQFYASSAFHADFRFSFLRDHLPYVSGSDAHSNTNYALNMSRNALAGRATTCSQLRCKKRLAKVREFGTRSRFSASYPSI